MADIAKGKIEPSLTSDDYPDCFSMVDVAISGRKQLCDQVYDVLSQKFHIIDTQKGE